MVSVKPVPQLGGAAAGCSVPVMLLPELSAAVVPLPALRCQSPIRPAWAAISMSLLAWMSAWLRAVFQIRTSSTTPEKKPPGVCVALVLREVPTAVMTFVAALAG